MRWPSWKSRRRQIADTEARDALAATLAGMPTDERIEIGRRAREVLADPVIELALDRYRLQLIEQLVNSRSEQTDARERIYQHVTALAAVKENLKFLANTGEHLAKQILRDAETEDRAQRQKAEKDRRKSPMFDIDPAKE